MHLSTIVASLVLAAVVAASPAPLTSVDSARQLAVRSPLDQSAQAGDRKLAAKCFSGCGSGVPSFTQGNFAQGPVVFSQQGSFNSFSSFTSSMNVFAAACTSTFSVWQSFSSIQSSIQIIHQQFQYMIVSMSTLLAPFQTACYICDPTQSTAYSQTVVRVIIQVQSMVSFIYQQFGGQLGVFQQEFSAVSFLFQTIVGIGATLNVNMQQLFISNQFNFQMFNACGIQTSSWFQTTNYFSSQHVGILARLLGPIVQAIDPLVDGVSHLLTGLGDEVAGLLSHLL